MADTRFLCFRNIKTREIARTVEVTGKSERHVDQVERGMLINIGSDWFVDDLTGDELKAAGGVVE